jgi:hypothetical protein
LSRENLIVSIYTQAKESVLYLFVLSRGDRLYLFVPTRGVIENEYPRWVDLLAAQKKDSTAGSGLPRRIIFCLNTFEFMAMVDGEISPKKQVLSGVERVVDYVG